jgi:hypothetical protein
MDQFVEVFKLISPTALPLVVVLLGGFWIYRKTQNIEQARKITKVERDTDSQKVHDDILKLQFKISELDGIVVLHRDKLDSIEKQLTTVNVELVKLNVQVEGLVKALERQNSIMEKMQNARATDNTR